VVKRKRTDRKAVEPYLKAAQENLQKTLGRKIRIISQGKRGKVVIEYYSQEDLENLIRALM